MKPQYEFQKYRFDYELDGVRGLCAIVVAFAHIFIFDHLIDLTYHPPKALKYLMFPHEAVLIFFIISGYVIGLTNNKPFNKRNAIAYVKKRIIRIYPIYILALLLSALLLRENTLNIVIGNLFFIQELYFPSISTNPVLWSLNFEVIFYILFIFIWWYQPNVLRTIMILLVLGIAGWFLRDIVSPVFSGYAVGLLYWLSGLVLAWYIKPKDEDVVNRHSITSLLLLVLAFANFKPGLMILGVLGLGGITTHLVNLSDIFTLPLCLVIIAITTKRIFPGLKYLLIYSYILVGLVTIYLVVAGRLIDRVSWVMGAGATILAFLIWIVKIKFDFSKLSFFGGFSYALYVFHFPLAISIAFLDISLFPNQVYNYLIKVLIWITVLFSFSFLVENVLQPKLKRVFI